MNEAKKEYLASMDLKSLRLERQEYIDRAREKVKTQNQIIKEIQKVLAEQPQTIPKLAESLAIETDRVLIYVATMKKYGMVGEGKKDGDYFTYQL